MWRKMAKEFDLKNNDKNNAKFVYKLQLHLAHFNPLDWNIGPMSMGIYSYQATYLMHN